VSAVLFLVHPARPAASDLAAAARVWWESRDYDVFVDRGPDPAPPRGVYDFAVSFGGDGTMLRTVQKAFAGQTPVIGINMGRMGYLTVVEPTGMETAFESLVAGDFKVEERMVLDVAIRHTATHPPADGHGDTSFIALNEAIVERTAAGHTIRVAVDIGGRRFLTYMADGLLVCTPTGSTAYNLSARGPVVSPNMRALVLTAVAPHLVFDRSLVLGPDETVTLTLLEGQAARLVLDGSRVVDLADGDSVLCSAAATAARLVTFGERDFHAVLRSRFSLADG